jgi:exodeoxyribonuclease-3
MNWNVIGLRSVLRKGALGWFIEDMPDVVCLQEIKVRPDQLTNDQISELRDLSNKP